MLKLDKKSKKTLNILYIVYFSLEDTKFLGVKKKIAGQANALKSLGNNVDIAYCHNNKLVIMSENEKKEIKCHRGITNYRRGVYKLFKNEINSEYYDMIYIRFPGTIDYYFYKTAKIFRNTHTKFILEMPTYPIDSEIKNAIKVFTEGKKYFAALRTSCNYFIHNIFKRKIHKTNIKIVTYMPYEKIWNIDTIVIDNGIDMDKIQKYNGKFENKSDKFNILIVANMEKWHGIDRVIYGMKEYIEKFPDNPMNVSVIIVGEGSVKEKLENITCKENLDKYISFLGLQDGEKMESLYKEATIAIGSLALYRIGIKDGSTLKVKEYCAKGIPFVLGYNEKEINENFRFALQIPANDQPLNIEECINFFNSIKELNYKQEMYEFAKQKYDWKIQMKKVLERIIERENKKMVYSSIVIIGTILILFMISLCLKKDFLDKIFLYITIFSCIFFTGLGVISKNIDNSEYLPYYTIFLLCTIGIVIYSIGKRKNVTNIKVSEIIENNKKLFNLLGVIALFLQFSILIYPELKIMNLFRFGGYEFDANYFSNRLELQNDIINRILVALKTATKPFLFIWLYNIKDKRIKVVLIYIFYEYISYANNYYIGRSSLISISVFIWIYLYEEKVFSRRLLKKLLIMLVISFIVITPMLANIRIKKENKNSLNNLGKEINSVIKQETETQQYLDVCNGAAGDLSFGKMLISILEAPLMFLPDVDFPVLSYEFTERLLGLEYGDKDYYIVLPCAYGEGVMLFGKQLSWVYGLFIGGVISYVYITLRKVPQFKFWLIFILMEYAKSFRGGIQTFVTYIWNSSFFLILLLIFLQIARRKSVNNGIIKEDTKE